MCNSASHRNIKAYRNFLQSGLNFLVGSTGSTTDWKEYYKIPSTSNLEASSRMTPIQFLRELQKHLPVKHDIHTNAFHLLSTVLSE